MILREQAPVFSVSSAVKYVWAIFFLTQIKPSATYRFCQQLAKLRTATDMTSAWGIISQAFSPLSRAVRTRYNAFFFNAAVRTS